MHVSGIPGRSVPEFVYKLMAAITGHISMVNDSTKCHLYSLQPTIPHSPPYSRHPPLPVLHSPLSLLHSTALISPLPAPHFPLPPKSQTPIYIPPSSHFLLSTLFFSLPSPQSLLHTSIFPIPTFKFNLFIAMQVYCRHVLELISHWCW